MPLVFFLTAMLACGVWGSTSDHRSQQGSDSVAAVILPAGGDIVLDGVGRATFGPGSFDKPQRVVLRVTELGEFREDLEFAAERSGSAPPVPLLVCVNTGPAVPHNDVSVTLAIPPSYVQGLPAGHNPRVYWYLAAGGPEELHMIFVPDSAAFDPKTRTVTVKVPPLAFLSLLTKDGSHELTLAIGSVEK